MSYCANENGTLDEPRSLTKAVEDDKQCSSAQSECPREKPKTRNYLQAELSVVEKKGEAAEQGLRSNAREILILEAEMEHLEKQTKVLHDRCASVIKENTELQARISKDEDDALMALKMFNTYRNKMNSHREAVMDSLGQTEAHKVLEEKRALAKMLTQKKEELSEDLENLNGNTAQMAKREIDDLKVEISVIRETTVERREQLRKAFETHSQIKKDIEIQNRRFEYIVKRLHYQLSRAQAVYRQMSEDVYYLERQLAELKKQVGSSQDSVVSGQ